jgi:probable HAF family extracellular repeat protein
VDGDDCSWARAINSRSQIVGQSFACDGSTLRAFLWENGSMPDLNKLIPRNSSLQLVDPLSINDRGEIAGIGVPGGCQLLDDASCGHAFVLVPCEHSGFEEGCEDTEEDSNDSGQGATRLLDPIRLAKPVEGSSTRREIVPGKPARFRRMGNIVPLPSR